MRKHLRAHRRHSNANYSQQQQQRRPPVLQQQQPPVAPMQPAAPLPPHTYLAADYDPNEALLGEQRQTYVAASGAEYGWPAPQLRVQVRPQRPAARANLQQRQRWHSRLSQSWCAGASSSSAAAATVAPPQPPSQSAGWQPRPAGGDCQECGAQQQHWQEQNVYQCEPNWTGWPEGGESAPQSSCYHLQTAQHLELAELEEPQQFEAQQQQQFQSQLERRHNQLMRSMPAAPNYFGEWNEAP